MAIIGGRAHTIEEIHEVGKLGYPFAEINLSDPEKINQQFNELLELKKTYGIYYLAHYPNEDNPTDTKILKKKFVPKMKKLLELTRDLEIHKGTIHFWIDRRWSPPGLIPAKIKILSELTSHASGLGVELCIENLTERHDSFATAFNSIPDLKMTMDIGHGELLSSENTSFGFMQNVFEKISHVHVHDNNGGNGVKDDLHLPLGDGIVNYPKILTILNEKGYNSTITMEVKPLDMPLTREVVDKYIR